MKQKIATVVALFLLLSGISLAQGLNFRYAMDVDTTMGTLHGIAVDPDGKIWYSSNNDATGITVLNSDLTPASFSPVTQVTIGGTAHDIPTLCKGMSVDPEGNIIVVMNAVELYRINYKDGTGMTFVHLPTLTSTTKTSFTKPGVDDAGKIYIASVTTDTVANPIWIIAPDFTLAGQVTDAQVEWSRAIEVSGDGKDVLMGNIFGSAPIYHFHSDDNVTYTLSESFPQPQDFFGGATSAINRDKEGRFWISDEGYPCYWVYNPSDQSYTRIGELGDPNMLNPRGVGFSVTGDTVYMIHFGLGKVQLWTNTPPPAPDSLALFDDFEDGDTSNVWGGGWDNFSDGGGASNINFEMSSTEGYNSSKSIHITGKFGSFGGVFSNLTSDASAMDLTGVFDGVSFAAKAGNGSTVPVRIRVRELKAESARGYAYFVYDFTPTADWQVYVVPFSTLIPQYGDPVPPFDLTDIYAIDFGPTAGNQSVDVFVDDVVFYGGNVLSVEPIENTSLPTGYSLKQNYPNPFNPSTTIEFSLVTGGFASLKVYDVLGNEVATLVNEELSSGNFKTQFDASQLSSGIYFYTLRVNNSNLSNKMLLIK